MTEASRQMRQVLGFFWPESEGAHTPGGFVEALIRAVCKADQANQDMLYSSFPAAVWAVKCCREEEEDLARWLILEEIKREEEGPL